MATVVKYGMNWNPVEWNDLDIEMEAIKLGGLSEGFPFHYEQMRRILWPELDDHRWHRLCRDTILKEKVTVLAGCASSAKTHSASWLYLCEYLCFPEETCVLVSSTTIPALRMRVWGEITKLWQEAKDQYPELPGHLLDGRIAITTDALEDGDWEERRVRDMRRGICGVPCVSGGKFIGLSKYMGIKQKRMRLIADEASAMEPGFLSAFSNLNANPDFRAVICGNFNDIMDCLGIAAEPVDGWDAHLEPSKTTTWRTKFYNGVCVNLIGTDSPNNDFPEKPVKYPYLISKKSIAETLSAFDKDSMEYYSMCVGSMKIATLQRRILTRQMVKQYGADLSVIWDGKGENTRVYAIDASYGGDRCVGGEAEFGIEVGGKTVLAYKPPHIIPVRVNDSLSPEDQIATFAMTYCQEHGIPPENVFHDSTGRGSLGTAFARLWSSKCNPVEFGGRPTKRPVSTSMMVYDPVTNSMRPKLWDEHVDRFVTELWWAMRITVESSQIRSLPEEAISELCMREWNKKEKQPITLETKDEMKKRSRRSPDFGDWSVIILEGARRLGFEIDKLGNNQQEEDEDSWLEREAAKHRRFSRQYDLTARR